jgi:hypothetical protein
MPRHHMIDGVKVLFTEEEEVARDAEEAAWASGALARAAEEVQSSRRSAYQSEADALFFEEQRGEVSAGTWAAKIDEIKARYPKD